MTKENLEATILDIVESEGHGYGNRMGFKTESAEQRSLKQIEDQLVLIETLRRAGSSWRKPTATNCWRWWTSYRRVLENWKLLPRQGHTHR